jgi:hypothetical protein
MNSNPAMPIPCAAANSRYRAMTGWSNPSRSANRLGAAASRAAPEPPGPALPGTTAQASAGHSSNPPRAVSAVSA